MENNLVAVIDLGTNTFHLLVAQKQGTAGFTPLLARQFVARIGKGGISKGVITDEAYSRALQGLQEFRHCIDHYGISVDKVYAVATSAIRNAANGPELIKDIYDQTGIKVKIISGEEEAELIYLGVRASMNLEKQNSMIVDIGGGSVEFIICSNKGILWKQSFEVGAQRLLDRFMHTDPISMIAVMKLQEYLQEQLIPLTNAVHQYAPRTLIGASGAFDTLLEIYHQRYQIATPASTTAFELPLRAFSDIYEELLGKSKEQRLSIPGMLEMRVDMIVVASCLIDLVLNQYGITNICASAYALKEGLLCKILAC